MKTPESARKVRGSAGASLGRYPGVQGRVWEAKVARRYEARTLDEDTYDVVYVDTGEPVVIHGMAQIGLEEDDASRLADALHTIDRLVSRLGMSVHG